jgi:ethanolamine ammonia-lyase small subunit
MDNIEPVHSNQGDPLAHLRDFTAARIGIGRTGASIPIKQTLAFKLAHAHARDAVYSELDLDKLSEELNQSELPVLTLQSQAVFREQYLQRPDLGRQLNKESLESLSGFINYDVVIIIADGLSANAVNSNATGLLKILLPQLQSAGLRVAPLCLIKQGRVAVADDIGMQLRAKLSIILIGERPGLSAADSMGAYITFKPCRGLTDESRNCVSNIRPRGLDFISAAKKIFYLVQEAFKRKLTGVGLKDNAGLLNG